MDEVFDPQTAWPRLVWRCRRGMLELDLMLNACIEHCKLQSEPEVYALFHRLLAYTDPELFAFLMGHDVPKDKELSDFVHRLRTQYSSRSLT